VFYSSREDRMPIDATLHADGVLELVMRYPPVNALPIEGWFGVARALRSVDERPEVHAVVLRADGRGFNAGIDLKEAQAGGDAVFLEINRACAVAFSAVRQCAVPVVAAVHGYCLGGGLGLVGNADLVIASDDASFGLPEVDRGALGAATHLARMVPLQRVRHMVYTCARASAAELRGYGSILDVVPRDDLPARALAVAHEIAIRPNPVIRAAKASLDHLDPVDVHRSYRMEQGYTFELHIAGHGARARAAVLDRA
jgi:enoyl-CoA hydratase